MADIHILAGVINDEYQATYRWVMHFPTGADQALRDKAVLDHAVSGFESALGDLIEPTELAQLRAGLGVERTGTIKIHKDALVGEYVARLRDDYAVLAAVVGDEFERRYQYYGSTLASEA